MLRTRGGFVSGTRAREGALMPLLPSRDGSAVIISTAAVPLDPRAVARMLGGRAIGHHVYAPGPGHSRRDRSLSVKIDPDAPDGFIVASFAGEDWSAAKDYVRTAVGLPAYARTRHEPTAAKREAWARQLAENERVELVRQARRSRNAIEIWRGSTPIAGTIAEKYLLHRLAGASIPRDVIEADALRFNERCPFWNEVTRIYEFLPAMVGLFRNVETGEPQSIHRTFLKEDGSGKAEMPDEGEAKRMLGEMRNAAIMLTPFEDVSLGLGIAEGIETGLTLIVADWRPIWVVGSSGAIERFPVLPGLDQLTIFPDHDRAGQVAAHKCTVRWAGAGRAWTILTPRQRGADWNDIARGAG